jgi:hypothetical protein
MTKLPLTRNLLTTILLVQSYQEFRRQESHYRRDVQSQPPIDWRKAAKEYFFGMDDDDLAALQLVKNEYCVNAVLDFNVSAEIRRTEYKLLPERFSFIY